MQKKAYISIGIYFLCMQLFAEEPQQPPSLHLNLHTHSENVLNLEHARKKRRCFHLVGNALKECIHTLSKKKQKKLLTNVSKHDRLAYVKTLNFNEFKKFLDSFTEDEWKNFIAHLSEDEQKHWPPTVAEQKKKLEEIYDASVSQMNWDVAKNIAFDVVVCYPVLPAMAFIIATDVWGAAKRSNTVQAEEFKKYIEEKFG